MNAKDKKINKITNPKDVEMFLNLREQDITTSFIMNNFAEFNGNPPKYNTFDEITIPTGRYGLGELKNIKPFDTTLGSWIFNKYFIEKDFIQLIGYTNDAISSKVFKKLNSKITYALLEDDITVDQFKEFLMKTQKFTPYVSIFAPSVTMKLLLSSKEIAKEKKRLLKQYEKEIAAGDSIIAEKIEKDLLKYAEEYLEGDDSMDCYKSGARMNMGNHFKNMHIMRGAAKDSDPDKGYNIMTSNYMDGFSKEEYGALCNSLTAGPYARGNKTRIGGYWEKLFVAAFQHLTLDPPGSDCGTKRYITVTLDNPDDYMYNYIIEGNNLVELTSKNVEKYRGKKVKMRFSALCESKTGFCNACAGNLFYRLGFTNIGVATAMIPSVLKNKSMKAFHDGTVKTTEMDVNRAFGIN